MEIQNKSASLAYFFLRVAMGINLFGHGLARIVKVQAFAEGMSKNFEKSWLPQSFVYAFGTALPIIELIIGLLLIVGFKTRLANIAGATLILILLFGSSTIENWEAMGVQMIYVLFFYLLLIRIHDNSISLDNKKHLFLNNT